MNKRLLIVDDDDAVRKMLVALLKGAGYDAIGTGTAEEALEMVTRDSVPVLLTDIMLPGMDGFELVKRLKSEHDVDVIMMTGYDEHSYEEAVKRGATDFILKPLRPGELILRVRRVFDEREVRQSRAQALEELEQLVITDSLTGIYNSRRFFTKLREEAERADRYKHPLSLLLLDIDHFKRYNDTYGHIEGDRVLAEIGKAIRSGLRSTDSAYRYGGEEFTVLLPETGRAQALSVAERVHQAVGALRFAPKNGEVTGVTVSVGVTEYVFGEDVRCFVERADQAMYESKHAGRDRVTLAPNGSGDQ